MSGSNITKQALAKSLKKLMEKKPFRSITVREIVEECGLTRPAFYYHFRDKYDLMNWIYYTETAGLMSGYSDREFWTDGLRDLCRYMRENRLFYINALNTTGQNSFPEYLHGYIRDIAASVIERLGKEKFSEEKWGFLADYVATSLVALIVRWANGGMREDPAEYFEQMRRIFDGSIMRELGLSEDGEKRP